MKQNIALVGFSGAGKSVLGIKLAKILDMSFVDLDAAIEDKYRTSVSLIFANYGELVFRKCEFAVLQEVLQRDKCVIATGGGAPCSDGVMELINEYATSVYLKLEEDTIVRHLMASRKRRPLTAKYNEAQLRQYVHETLAHRAPYYQKADLVVYSDDGNFDAEIVARNFR